MPTWRTYPHSSLASQLSEVQEGSLGVNLLSTAWEEKKAKTKHTHTHKNAVPTLEVNFFFILKKLLQAP